MKIIYFLLQKVNDMVSRSLEALPIYGGNVTGDCTENQNKNGVTSESWFCRNKQ